MIPFKLRRGLSLAIPLFSALLFLGIFTKILGVGASTNIASTGITLGLIFGLLNLWLVWLTNNHLVP